MSRKSKTMRQTLLDEVSVPVETAAEALGIKRSSAYEAVRNDELPHIRIGRRVSVPTAVLRRMLGIPEPRP
jgi:excisionase family DNA binding protein